MMRTALLPLIAACGVVEVNYTPDDTDLTPDVDTDLGPDTDTDVPPPDDSDSDLDTESDTESDPVIAGVPPRITLCEIQPLGGTMATPWAGANAVEDDDGDALTESWMWQQEDGGVWSDIPGATTSSLPSCVERGGVGTPPCFPGDQLRLRCTVEDGNHPPVQRTSDAVTIGSRPPTVSVVITPLDPVATSVLAAEATTDDPDGDAVDVAWAWTLNGVVVSSDPVLSGVSLRGGDTVSVTATASDVWGEVATASAALVIGNSPPEVQRCDVVPPVGDVTTAWRADAEATDVDGDPITWTWAWQTLVAGTFWLDLPDGTSITRASCLDTRVPPNDPSAPLNCLRGSAIRVLCTARDASSSPSTLASAPVTLVNAPPVATSVDILPASPSSQDDLTASAAGSDPDEDTIAWTYAWRVNGVLAGTGPTLSRTLIGPGDTVQLTASPNDGIDLGTPMSAVVVIENTPPVVTDCVVSPGRGTGSTAWTATSSGADPDGGAITQRWQWEIFVAGAWTAIPGDVSASKPPCSTTDVAPSDPLATYNCATSSRLRVVCTLQDADGGTASLTSSVVAVSPTFPTLRVEITPGNPNASQTLVADLTVTEPTPQPGISWTPSFQWALNGVPVSGETQPTYAGPRMKGDSVTVRAKVEDPWGFASPFVEDVIVIQNAPPVADTCEITPGSGTVATAWEATALASDIDPTDAPFLSLGYTWQILQGGLFWVDIPGEQSRTLAPCLDRVVDPSSPQAPLVNCRAGDQLRVRCVPRDPSGPGAPSFSDPVTIDNTPPVIEDVALDPSVPVAGEAVLAVATIVDADGDTWVSEYAWTVNGAPSGLDPMLAGGITSSGDVVEVTVVATDTRNGESEPFVVTATVP